MKQIIFRMDDVGAASKRWEVYGRNKIENILFIKYLPWVKRWGVYEELSAQEWEDIGAVLKRNNAKMTVGVTACWVERNEKLIPFPQKYPEQANALKKLLESGCIEIANHGLTHCLVGKHVPKLFSSNRQYHREFYDTLPEEEHKYHLERSQAILQNYFEIPIISFVPPGNVWNTVTENYAQRSGIQYLSAKQLVKDLSQSREIATEIFAFHDREVKLFGVSWLENKIREFEANNILSQTVKGYFEVEKNNNSHSKL
jgi:hypothetical protein